MLSEKINNRPENAEPTNAKLGKTDQFKIKQINMFSNAALVIDD